MAVGGSVDGKRRYDLAIRYFIIGQIGFFVALMICILFLPQGLTANGGFTYFGKHSATIIPYRFAYLFSGLFTLLSALILPNYRPFKAIRVVFILMLFFLLGLVFTTSTIRYISHFHVSLGTTLFVSQLVFGFWLAAIVRQMPRNTALFIALFIGGLISLLSLVEVIPYLLEGQMLFLLSFAALVTSALIGLRAAVKKTDI